MDVLSFIDNVPPTVTSPSVIKFPFNDKSLVTLRSPLIVVSFIDNLSYL
jgi:hypothetical protein